jgi:hypothetical protein
MDQHHLAISLAIIFAIARTAAQNFRQPVGVRALPA